MSTVIKVENLSKRYRLGLKESRKDTLMGQIAQTLRAPLDNLKRLRSMTRFNEEDESVFWALRDVNFEVKQGEVLGIIGHNGAGKSTLLKILSRITEPTDGRILINGRIAALLEVGTGFHQDLTGRENIYMNGTILGMTRKEIDRKLDEIVDFSGVEKHLDTPVKFYSSGMKVRLGFAVAAHLEPEILIIDEVLAVGDAEFQKKCLGKMESVAGEGRTVLFVSHNMALINGICTKGLLLYKGGILAHGGNQEIVQQYLKNQYENTLSKQWVYRIPPNSIGLTNILTKVNGVNSNIVYSGARVELELSFESLHSEMSYDFFSLSILIFRNDEKICNLWSSYDDIEIKVAREVKIKCIIDKWPFRSGYFRFDIYTHNKQIPLEWIEQVVYLQGEDGDYYGNSIVTNPDQGYFYLNHKFIVYAV